MGLWQALKYRLGRGRGGGPPERWSVDELARRLGMSPDELRAVRPGYRSFRIPKRGGGEREIHAPDPELRNLQRRILRRLLRRLRCHPAVTGFERGHSIVTNANPHVGRAVVLRMDLKQFFPSTSAKRVEAYFRTIGWSREAAEILTRLCTHNGALPQGAPTSPRLSNLVNLPMDTRLYNLAGRCGAVYTRYADDLTFSLASEDHAPVHQLIHWTKSIVRFYGYTLHIHKKLRIRRRHQRQVVTGLVVNRQAALPRRRRRWLRAVQHHLRESRPATLSAQQVAGWLALQRMVESQRQAGANTGEAC